MPGVAFPKPQTHQKGGKRLKMRKTYSWRSWSSWTPNPYTTTGGTFFHYRNSLSSYFQPSIMASSFVNDRTKLKYVLRIASHGLKPICRAGNVSTSASPS